METEHLVWSRGEMSSAEEGRRWEGRNAPFSSGAAGEPCWDQTDVEGTVLFLFTSAFTCLKRATSVTSYLFLLDAYIYVIYLFIGKYIFYS